MSPAAGVSAGLCFGSERQGVVVSCGGGGFCHRVRRGGRTVLRNDLVSEDGAERAVAVDLFFVFSGDGDDVALSWGVSAVDLGCDLIGESDRDPFVEREAFHDAGDEAALVGVPTAGFLHDSEHTGSCAVRFDCESAHGRCLRG